VRSTILTSQLPVSRRHEQDWRFAWPNHQHHASALRAVERSKDGWATCALTQLGFIRLSSNPAAIPAAKSPAEAASLLAAMTADPLHQYLDSLPSPLRDSPRLFAGMLGHNQVADGYLLTLANRNDVTFVTFDKRLSALAEPSTRVRVLA